MSLTLNPMLMLLVFAVFMLLIFFLNTWLYRPILKMFQTREELLTEDSGTLKDMRLEIEEIKKEIQEVLIQAREQAVQIKDEATKNAQNDYNERYSRAKVEIENRFTTSQREIRERKESLDRELAAKIPLFSQTMQNKFNSLGELK